MRTLNIVGDHTKLLIVRERADGGGWIIGHKNNDSVIGYYDDKEVAQTVLNLWKHSPDLVNACTVALELLNKIKTPTDINPTDIDRVESEINSALSNL